MREVVLPSGAKLEIDVAPFAASKALYQAVLEEAKLLKLDPAAEVDANLYKDLFCTALASKKIEMAMGECLKRVTYNGLKITVDTFEPVEARDDYFTVMFEVAKDNIQPFTKSLSLQFADVFQKLVNSRT